MKNNILISLLFTLLLTSCSSHYGRYQQRHDSKPTRKPSAVELKNAIPRPEAKSKGGNKNYSVRGNRYEVLDSAKGFKQTGTASWYGKKFHGHLTSNGEIYNMYSMSAAHKNLPLPTYAKVTNLANNKFVIVRVNDRGPFHEDRVIDLSYSAAYKLDMLKSGTANVTIEAITSFERKKVPLVEKAQLNYIQVFATSNEQVATKTSNAIENLYRHPTKARVNNGIYKIQIGPIDNPNQLLSLIERLRKNGYPQAFKVTL